MHDESIKEHNLEVVWLGVNCWIRSAVIDACKDKPTDTTTSVSQIQKITDNTVARGRSVTWPHVPLVQVQFSSVYMYYGIEN